MVISMKFLDSNPGSVEAESRWQCASGSPQRCSTRCDHSWKMGCSPRVEGTAKLSKGPLKNQGTVLDSLGGILIACISQPGIGASREERPSTANSELGRALGCEPCNGRLVESPQKRPFPTQRFPRVLECCLHRAAQPRQSKERLTEESMD